jgi:RNA polymerase sigma-70 factor (ECF subfamily)
MPDYYMEVDDRILREIRKKDHQAFEALFFHYYPALTRYAEGFVFERSSCEDIVQNLFIYIWENADRIHIRTSFESYLYRSVRNRCLNHLRELNVMDKHRVLYFEAMLNSELPMGENEDVEIHIKSVLKTLPKKMAQIFELKYLKGKKQKEIAEKLNITENTVKTQLLRARTRLREVLSHLLSLTI